ncbi:MAG: aminotransferase class I/II-fold pyridoxal phosphate-dependent enzyme [Planctomycetes bacterium]|nr:aminotransferase class I/II-fold pyridoxal phosphate-dependent enzyme [Planctomycetota bacterium]
MNSELQSAFDPDCFRRQGHRLIDLLSDYLKASINGDRRTVLPNIEPETMLERWTGDFQRQPSMDFEAIVQGILEDSNNLHHPRYIGHQCCTPLPLAALNSLVGSFLNNGSAVYEMGPVNVAMEKRLVQWMCGLIGYDENADGIFTHGGTVGNLTAFLAARQAKAPYDVWKQGVGKDRPLTVLIPDQSHYCIKRAVSVMGLGEEAVMPVPIDDRYHLDIDVARRCHKEATDQGRRVFLIVGNGCSTGTGSYDRLDEIADFAEEHDLWFHVDGAHGASALVSEKYRHLLKGSARADSMVWDAHKMLMTPALATAVLFKDGAHSYQSFSQKASYLFEKESRDEWYNYAHRTMECTKSMMGLNLYVPLAVFGTDLFSNFVTSTYDLTQSFAQIIKADPDFELAVEPESNIICFRYLKNGVENLDELQRIIRREIIKDERFYIVQTALADGFYLRCTIINPHTGLSDLQELLNTIRTIASAF